jgi:hypothetical protein
MPGWTVSTRSVGEQSGLARDGKTLVQVWISGFHCIGVYNDGSWQWSVYSPLESDGIVGQGMSAEDLAASWDKCVATPIFSDSE